LPLVTEKSIPIRNMLLQYNFVFDRAGGMAQLNNPNWPQWVNSITPPNGNELANGKSNIDVPAEPLLPDSGARGDGLARQDGARDLCTDQGYPARNGGRSLKQVFEHMANDSLVGWAWAPGYGRAPAPGTQKELGVLLANRRRVSDVNRACASDPVSV
jgi:hypothetical protein